MRSAEQLDRVALATRTAGASANVLDENVEIRKGQVSLSTMHLAKGLSQGRGRYGLRRRGVPLQARIEAVGDESDLKEVYDTERHLPLRGLHPCARLLACQCGRAGFRISYRLDRAT